MLLLSLALTAATTCTLSTSPGVPAPQTLELDIAGTKRTAIVVVGKDAASTLKKGERAPLVFVWHGFGGSPRGMQRAFGPSLSTSIAVYPQGLGRTFPNFGDKPQPGWQVRKNDLGGRDLLFFDALRKHLVDTTCVDEDRLTSTGFSNGGLFSNILGCYRANVLAGIAPISGAGPRGAMATNVRPSSTRAARSCKNAIPVVVVHGTKDRILPFKLGEGTAQHWSKVNGCKSAVATTPAGSCSVASACKAPVRFCAHSGGHTLPREMSAEVATFLLAQRRAR